ncbi:MAG: hypothetical protein U0840_00475 [Gemmataceae bacterium]
MPTNHLPPSHSEPGRYAFQSTRWSVVLAAGGEGNASRLALEELFRIYWAPLYIFARRQGAQSHDAEEQVQSFFSWLLEKSILGRADQARGRFRNFLLVSFKQFMARQAEYAAAAKRRPAHPVLSIDAARAEQFLAEPYHEQTPDKEFDYAWALALLHRANQRLRDEYHRDGKEQRYEVLKNCLTDNPRLQGREMAQLLGMTEGAVRVAIHRLKQRFGEILREEIGQTLDSSDDIDAELADLLTALTPPRA